MKRAGGSPVVAFEDGPDPASPLCGARFRLPAVFVEVPLAPPGRAGPDPRCRTCLYIEKRRT